MEEQQKFKTKGMIDNVSVQDAPPGSSWKQKGTIYLKKEDGSVNYISSFNEEDIKDMQAKSGSLVTVTYTKNGKYKNLVEGGLEVIGDMPPKIEEETVSNNVKTPEKPTNNFNSEGKDTTPKEKSNDSVANFKNKEDLNNRRGKRAMAVSYAKDLVVAGKLELKDMKAYANEFYEFIWDGYSSE